MDLAWLRRIGFRTVPARIIGFTVVMSVAGQLLGLLQRWPLWAVVLAAALPWIPVFALDIAWSYRHYGWLAIFYLLVVSQGGHVIEHVAQMVQIHVLEVPPPQAHGIFGALDIEWVHVAWNTWVLVAVVALLWRFPNRWLWVGLVIAGWHETEHLYIMSKYLPTGVPGNPGLLAKGGAIGGGIGLIRPDLHFIYNVVETIPLVVAFVLELRRSYSEYVAKALPGLTSAQLAQTTSRLRSRTYQPGEVVIQEGDLAREFFVIVRGEAEVLRKDDQGRDVITATLGTGEFFGEIGLMQGVLRTATVRAKTPLEVLALERSSFAEIVQGSAATARDIDEVVKARTSRV